ncbi:MAG: DUF1566 domain-containing protein [Thermodesulfobacteriota bacterium]
MKNNLLLIVTLIPFLLTGCADLDDSRFNTLQNKMVMDEETGLMWATADNQENIDWNDAIDYCATFNGGGYRDWRLPTVEELAELYEAGIKLPEKKRHKIYFSDDKPLPIKISDRSLWASDTRGSAAAYCNASRGGCGYLEKAISITLRALPVRTASKKEVDTAQPAIQTAPPATSPSKDAPIEQKMKLLKKMYDDGLLTDEEYSSKKQELLKQL